MRFVLYITVFICTDLHIVVSVYAFVALRCVPFCVPFLTEKGGTARFAYLLDADSAELVSRNRLEVTVTHVN